MLLQRNAERGELHFFRVISVNTSMCRRNSRQLRNPPRRRRVRTRFHACAVAGRKACYLLPHVNIFLCLMPSLFLLSARARAARVYRVKYALPKVFVSVTQLSLNLTCMGIGDKFSQTRTEQKLEFFMQTLGC